MIFDLLTYAALGALLVLAVVGAFRPIPWWPMLLPGLALVCGSFVAGVTSGPQPPFPEDPLPDVRPFLMLMFGGFALLTALMWLITREVVRWVRARRA